MVCIEQRNQSILGSCSRVREKWRRLRDGSGQHPQTASLSVYQSIYVTTLPHNHELRLKIWNTRETSFLRGVDVLSLGDGERSAGGRHSSFDVVGTSGQDPSWKPPRGGQTEDTLERVCMLVGLEASWGSSRVAGGRR